MARSHVNDLSWSANMALILAHKQSTSGQRLTTTTCGNFVNLFASISVFFPVKASVSCSKFRRTGTIGLRKSNKQQIYHRDIPMPPIWNTLKKAMRGTNRTNITWQKFRKHLHEFLAEKQRRTATTCNTTEQNGENVQW